VDVPLIKVSQCPSPELTSAARLWFSMCCWVLPRNNFFKCQACWKIHLMLAVLEHWSQFLVDWNSSLSSSS